MDPEVMKLLQEWQTVKVQLEEQHRNRSQQEVIKLMKQGIHLFLQFLLKSNEREETSLNDLNFSQLSLKPVNAAERIEFIKTRPALFHSFIQLSELMGELEKIYQKNQAIKKASRRKS